MELTKSKLNKILKKYKVKLEQHNKDWENLCRTKCKHEIIGDKVVMTTPSIYDHEKHNSKGATLFKNLMAEFEGYDVFPKKSNQ